MTTIEELMKELKELTVKVEKFIKNKEEDSSDNNTLKKNKFKLVVEKIEKKEDSESSSSDSSLSTDSCPISESCIDFFPAKYRTIHINLNLNNVVITKLDKIIQLNY